LKASHNGRRYRRSIVRFVLILAVVALTIAAYAWRRTPVAKVARTSEQAVVALSAEAKNARRVYPFSVIHGGAYSAEELARARKVDAVVARHYTGFGVSPAVLHTSTETFMYVSYRKADRVFWTKTKHKIRRGEAVLSDGQNLARTRCGNRLSPKPQAPVAPGEEPTEEALDFPDKPKAALKTPALAAPTPDADFFVPGNSADLASPVDISAPSAPAMSTSGLSGGNSEKPYTFGGTPGGAGPFLGPNLFYPTSGGVAGDSASGNAAGNSDIGGTNSSGSAANLPFGGGLVTPEPGTLSLLVMGALLAGPTVVRRSRNRAQAIRRNK
jgi:hypothetical protein